MSQGISSQQLDDGSSVLFMPYDQDLVQKAVKREMDGQVNTPDPNTSKQKNVDRTGPIQRYNDLFTDLGSTLMEALALDGFEISNTIKTRRDELFRNNFPVFIPAFEVKCLECETEYSSTVEECDVCGGTEFREPDVSEKERAKELFSSVNKEGQTLRDIMAMGEEDHARIGVSTIVVKHQYTIASGNSTVLGRPLFDEGQVISKEVDEIVKGDPKRIVPVTDDNGRIGGWKWTCPIHRKSAAQKQPGHCPECGTELKEIHYVEKKYVRTRKAYKYYFEDEVVTWSYFFPRQNGLDGLSPIHHVWIKQAILYWMDVFGAAYYDPNSDSFPNKFMVVHTTDEEAWKRNFRDMETDKPENLYANQIFVNEYSDQSRSTPEVQTVDLMDDELRGQNEQIKKSYKSDIRSHFGVTDVFDSELEDAGGLNNEGLQLEVTDRHIATSHQNLANGPLREIANIVGLDDWEIGFVPPQSEDLDDLEQKIDIGSDAADAGLDAKLRDSNLVIEDGEFEESDQGGGGLFGSADYDPELSPFDEKTTQQIAEKYADVDWKSVADEIDEVQHALSEPEIEAKASVFSGRGRTPKYVRDLADDAIEGGAVFEDMKGIDDVDEFEETLKEHLTADGGWSETELSEAISEKFDVTTEKAKTLARDQSQNVLNQAKQLAHTMGGNLDERTFYYTGPMTQSKCQACTELVQETDPSQGGEPMLLPDLLDKLEELNREHYDHDNVGYKMHINCQDTVVEA